MPNLFQGIGLQGADTRCQESKLVVSRYWKEVEYRVMTDPIADMLTRIRNALVVKHEEIQVPASNIKKAIADILAEEVISRDIL